MNSQYIRQIVEQLALATGQPIVVTRNSYDQIEQTSIYSVEDIHRFIEDLGRSTRLNNLTLVVNQLPLQEFIEFIATAPHPVLYFEKHNLGLTPVIVGQDSQGKKIQWSPIIENRPHLATTEVKSPLLFENQADLTKNGQVLYLTAFPMQPLVSDDSTLRQTENEVLTPIQRLIRLLRNERKDIGYIYFYAVVVGLISLILPLGVQIGRAHV